MRERPSHYRRRQIAGLTPRQREVLALLARGHTNAQVAEALGISLDTAKFHVSEILSRLEVSSREEAVEAWRARQRAPSLHRLAGLLAVPRVRHILAAGGTVAAVALALLLFASTRTDEDRLVAPTPGVHIALVQPAPGAVRYGDWVAPIRLLEVTSGAERLLGPSSRYLDVSIAPDGSRVAALAFERHDDPKAPLDARVCIWAIDGRLLKEIRLPADQFATHLAWSPDSTRLALLVPGMMILDADGTELGWLPPPQRAGGGSSSQGVPSQPWSADSQHVAAMSNELLLIGQRDGLADRTRRHRASPARTAPGMARNSASSM